MDVTITFAGRPGVENDSVQLHNFPPFAAGQKYVITDAFAEQNGYPDAATMADYLFSPDGVYNAGFGEDDRPFVVGGPPPSDPPPSSSKGPSVTVQPAPPPPAPDATTAPDAETEATA